MKCFSLVGDERKTLDGAAKKGGGFSHSKRGSGGEEEACRKGGRRMLSLEQSPQLQRRDGG